MDLCWWDRSRDKATIKAKYCRESGSDTARTHRGKRFSVRRLNVYKNSFHHINSSLFPHCTIMFDVAAVRKRLQFRHGERWRPDHRQQRVSLQGRAGSPGRWCKIILFGIYQVLPLELMLVEDFRSVGLLPAQQQKLQHMYNIINGYDPQ